MPAPAFYKKKSFRQRLYCGLYFAFWGSLLNFGMLFTGPVPESSTVFITTLSGWLSGFVMGSIFSVFFFFDEEKSLAPSPRRAFMNTLLGGLMISLFAWPLVGFFSTLFECFLRREAFDAAFLLGLKGAFFFFLIGSLTLFGWTISLFVILAAFLFRSAVKYQRLNNTLREGKNGKNRKP